MYEIIFDVDGKKIRLEANSRTSLYVKILNWLKKRGYKFTGDIHQGFTKRILSREEVNNAKVSKPEIYGSQGRFYEINPGEYFYLYRNKDVYDFWKKMLVNNGVDEKSIEIKEIIDQKTDSNDYLDDKKISNFKSIFFPKIKKISNFEKYSETPNNNITLLTGVDGCRIEISIRKTYVSVFVSIYHWVEKNNEFVFNFLLKNKKDIEESIGRELDWKNIDSNRGSSITLRKNLNMEDESNWVDAENFLLRYFQAFEQIFIPYFEEIKKIKRDLSETDTEEPKELSTDDSKVLNFAKFREKPVERAEQPSKTQSVVKNTFKQSICVLGAAGAGKSLTTINSLKGEKNHFFKLLIPDDMRVSILLKFEAGEMKLNSLSKMIIKAYENPQNKYTVLIDEFHKPITLRRVNDELLQAISTKRYGGVRFISSETAFDEISKELEKLGIKEDIYDYHGNIVIPDNFGFILLSSKPDVIVDNDDLYGRLDIVYLRESDRTKFTTVNDFDESRIHTYEDKKEFKNLIKSDDNDLLNEFIDKFNK